MRYYILKKTNNIIIHQDPLYNLFLLNLDKVINKQVQHVYSRDGIINWENNQIWTNLESVIETEKYVFIDNKNFNSLIKKAYNEPKSNHIINLNNIIGQIKPTYLLTMFKKDDNFKKFVNLEVDDKYQIKTQVIQNKNNLISNVIIKCKIEIIRAKLVEQFIVLEYKVNQLDTNNFDLYSVSFRADGQLLNHNPSNDFNGLELYNIWPLMLTNNLIEPNIKFVKSNGLSQYYLSPNKKYYTLLE